MFLIQFHQFPGCAQELVSYQAVLRDELVAVSKTMPSKIIIEFTSDDQFLPQSLERTVLVTVKEISSRHQVSSNVVNCLFDHVKHWLLTNTNTPSVFILQYQKTSRLGYQGFTRSARITPPSP